MTSYIYLICFIILIIGAPLAIGSVYIVTFSAFEFIIFSLCLIKLCDYRINKKDEGEKLKGSTYKHFHLKSNGINPVSSLKSQKFTKITIILIVPLFIFLIVALFQLIPLPIALISFLSKNTVTIYKKLGLPQLMNSGLFTLSLSPYSTTVLFLKWASYVCIFFLISTFSPTEKGLKNGRWLIILSSTFFVIGLFEAIYGLYTYLYRSDSILWFTRLRDMKAVAGTYVNRNHFAGFINICIFVSIGLLIASVLSYKKKEKGLKNAIISFASSRMAPVLYVLCFGIIIMILSLTFTLSRMGQFSLIAGFASLILLFSFQKKKMVSFFIVCIIIASFLWASWKGLEPVYERWFSLEDSLHQDRLLIYESTVKLIKDFPIFGKGFGTFELSYPPYKPEKFGAAIYDHAHNDYLQILAETGWAGFLPWALFFITYLFLTTYAFFKTDNPISRGMGAGGIAATVALLLHSFFDFNLQIPANALLLFIVMAMTWRVVNYNVYS